MPIFKIVIILLGVGLVFVGTWVMFKNSPLNVSVIDGGGSGTDFSKLELESELKNQRMKIGVGMILIGTVLQVITNFI